MTIAVLLFFFLIFNAFLHFKKLIGNICYMGESEELRFTRELSLKEEKYKSADILSIGCESRTERGIQFPFLTFRIMTSKYNP